VTITVPNVRIYSVAGLLPDGAIYADTEDGTTGTINSIELVELLEASDGSMAGNPEHAAAIILAAKDFEALLTSTEQACADLGKYCNAQAQSNLKAWRKAFDRTKVTR
jgi:hypothetical protein